MDTFEDKYSSGGVTGFSWNYVHSQHKLHNLIYILAKLHDPIKKVELYDNTVDQTFLCMSIMKIITRP